ncbi:MAG: sigma-70 family RNA polymerase sigma factor [Candidatus Micrarchaeia archaeon]
MRKNKRERPTEKEITKTLTRLCEIHSRSIIKRQRVPSYVSKNDLFQEGFMAGLEKVHEKYDYSRANLETFLDKRARGAMIDFLLRESMNRKVMKRDHIKLLSKIKEFESKKGRFPSARELGTTRKELEVLKQSSGEPSSLNNNPWEKAGILPRNISEKTRRTTKYESSASAEDEAIKTRITPMETRNLLKKAVEDNVISSRERFVMVHSFGLLGRQMKKKEIAEELKLSPGRISQINFEAKKKLRKAYHQP